MISSLVNKIVVKAKIIVVKEPMDDRVLSFFLLIDCMFFFSSTSRVYVYWFETVADS